MVPPDPGRVQSLCRTGGTSRESLREPFHQPIAEQISEAEHLQVNLLEGTHVDRVIAMDSGKHFNQG